MAAGVYHDQNQAEQHVFTQIAFGTFIMLASIISAAINIWALEYLLMRLRGWLTREPHWPKLIFLVCVSALAVLAQVTVSVWLWAFGYLWIGAFDALEPAVYFSLVSFTTLGYGDILLPEEWRLLGGMAATNGLLNIGLLTAVLIEGLRNVRLTQIELRRRP